MNLKHNFVQLAEVQRQQKTLYCGGLDPHSFEPGENEKVYRLGKEEGGETCGRINAPMRWQYQGGLPGHNHAGSRIRRSRRGFFSHHA